MSKKLVESNKETRRKRIIRAAIDIITEDGYPQLNLDKVVSRAGTSKSAIYSVFKNKLGLLKAIVDEAVFNVSTDMISKLDKDMPVDEVLSKLLESYIRQSSSKEYNATVSMIINEMKDSKAIGEYYFEVGPLRVLQKTEKYLKIKVTSGELDIADCGVVAKHLLGSIAWYRTSLLMYSQVVDTDVEKLLVHGRIAIDAFLKAYLVKK